MKQFTEKETQIINRFNEYKAWAREELPKMYSELSYRKNNPHIYGELTDEDFCYFSGRYRSLVKIGEIISEENFLDKLYAYGQELFDRWEALEQENCDELDKESANWEQEGFESRDDYYDYLFNSRYNTDTGYDMLVVENLIADLYKKVLDEDYYLGY